MFEKLYQKIRLLRNKDKELYSSLYKILGFYPIKIHLYEQAFLHRSYSMEAKDGKGINNERLEFLGDAILDAVIADIIYQHFPKENEGFLTNTRSKIVSRETLNRIAVELGLEKMIVSSSRIHSNAHNTHMYGNALEALIGAVYLDQGYEKCYSFIKKALIAPYIDIDKLAKKEVNFKSNLIEWGQKNKLVIEFRVLESFCDNDKNPVFQTGVFIEDVEIGIGVGYSKKESQQHAAKMAIKRLKSDKEIRSFIIKQKRGKRVQTSQEDLPKEE